MGTDAENQLSKYWLKKLNTCGEAKILKELKAKYIDMESVKEPGRLKSIDNIDNIWVKQTEEKNNKQ